MKTVQQEINFCPALLKLFYVSVLKLGKLCVPLLLLLKMTWKNRHQGFELLVKQSLCNSKKEVLSLLDGGEECTLEILLVLEKRKKKQQFWSLDIVRDSKQTGHLFNFLKFLIFFNYCLYLFKRMDAKELKTYSSQIIMIITPCFKLASIFHTECILLQNIVSDSTSQISGFLSPWLLEAGSNGFVYDVFCQEGRLPRVVMLVVRCLGVIHSGNL